MISSKEKKANPIYKVFESALRNFRLCWYLTITVNEFYTILVCLRQNFFYIGLTTYLKRFQNFLFIKRTFAFIFIEEIGIVVVVVVAFVIVVVFVVFVIILIAEE